MKMVKLISFLIILVVLGGWIILKSLTVYVAVGSAGVRTQEYGIFGSKGVIPKDFGPGWHRDLGPIDSWVIFDATVQTLEMTRDPQRGSVRGRDDVQVQSSDGYSVSVDVTVKYRIKQGMAHKVYQDTGSRGKYKTIVRNEAMNACMGVFGQMRTEDFYNPVERRRRASEAHEILTTALQRRYVEVVDVLIRDVQFDPAYEEKIRRKKLADQEVELNKSAARAAEMRGKAELARPETSTGDAWVDQQNAKNYLSGYASVAVGWPMDLAEVAQNALVAGLTAVAVSSLSIGLGAALPDYQAESAAKVASSFGGLVCMSVAILVALCIVGLAIYPAWVIHADVQPRVGRLVFCFLGAVALTATAVAVPLWLGGRAIGRHGR